MKVQTDQEFQQNDIKKLYSEFNVMFSTKVRGSKAFVAEQETREFKKILWKSKRTKTWQEDKIKRINKKSNKQSK